MHWLNSLTYVYCLLTGLAFYTPHLFWMAVVLAAAPPRASGTPLSVCAFSSRFSGCTWSGAATWRSPKPTSAF